MKTLILSAILAISSSFYGCLTQSAHESAVVDMPITAASEMTAVDRVPILVELFTSEGCSSCPPADRLLTTLNNGKLTPPNTEVITLGFHVDYWDGSSWRDRFSSREYTRRQQAYAAQLRDGSTYTPQMVVDGSLGFVGSNRAQANSAIAKGSEQKKGIVILKINGEKLTASVTGLGGHADATIYLAVAESNLSNRVSGGENSGETLVHSSVVRFLKPIGNITGKETERMFDLNVPANSEWKSENVRYVVFVQENASLKILAAAQIAK